MLERNPDGGLKLESQRCSHMSPKTGEELAEVKLLLVAHKKDLETRLASEPKKPDESPELHRWRRGVVKAIRFADADLVRIRGAFQERNKSVKLEKTAEQDAKAARRKQTLERLKALAEAGNTKQAVIELLEWLETS